MSQAGLSFENELLRAALDTARVGLCVCDEQGTLLIAGGEVVRKLGVDEEALLGRPVQTVLVQALVIENTTALFSVDAPEISVEGKLLDKSGAATIILFQARTLQKENERFRVITLIDITDFGVTRDRYLNLRRQLDAINSAIVIVDARAKDFPIVFVNKRFESMTGYSSEEAIGRNCRFLQGSHANQDEVRVLREATARESACQVVIRNVRKDGTEFLNDLYISPVFDESKRVTHFIGIQRELKSRSKPIQAGYAVA